MPSLLNISKNKLKTSNNDMKGTELLKQTIKHHLDARAKADKLFSANYAKEGKNIDDCITYILTQVRVSGCNGFADEEIYSMAIHYYDEDNIEVGDPIPSGQVVVNHQTEGAGSKSPLPSKRGGQRPPKPKTRDNEYVGDLFG